MTVYHPLPLKGAVEPGRLAFEAPEPLPADDWLYVEAHVASHLFYLTTYAPPNHPRYCVAFPLTGLAALLKQLPLQRPLEIRWNTTEGPFAGWLPKRCLQALRRTLRSNPAALDLFTAQEIEEAWKSFFTSAGYLPANALRICPSNAPTPLDLPLPF